MVGIGAPSVNSNSGGAFGEKGSTVTVVGEGFICCELSDPCDQTGMLWLWWGWEWSVSWLLDMISCPNELRSIRDRFLCWWWYELDGRYWAEAELLGSALELSTTRVVLLVLPTISKRLERRRFLSRVACLRKYFWAWLATWVGVLVVTKFLEIPLQSPFPSFSSPARNVLCSSSVHATPFFLSWVGGKRPSER